MVHSGSASSMKTTPSASPHLTLPAIAPPLQAAPLESPPGDITDQDLTHTPTKFHSTGLTSNSDLSLPYALAAADSESSVVTVAKAIAPDSSQASSSCTPTPTPVQGSVSGRTSGRKRTPKACECCGPNSTGHNVRTSDRGKGRGRWRGMGDNSGLWDTPKKRVREQLTHINSVDLAEEEVEEAEGEDNANEKVQMTEMTVKVANAHSQTPVALPVSNSLQDGPKISSAAPVKCNAQKKVEMSGEGSLVPGIGGKGGNGQDVEMRLSGMAGRGATLVRGRGMGKFEGTPTSETKEGWGIKREGLGGVVKTLKTYARPQFLQRHWPKKNVEVNPGEQPNPVSSVKSPLGNGDTVNLSDTEPEEESEESKSIMSEMENGLPSYSCQSCPASESASAHDLDAEKTNSVSALTTLSNGSVITQTNEDHSGTHMEVDTHSDTVAHQYQGPITVSLVQHCRALRDHRLYCLPGTWEEAMEEVSGKGGREIEGKMQGEEESTEQLIDLIHEFLESFYMKYGGFIPLSETDVLEYLKKKGNSDPGNRGVDIKREMTRYRAGLASAPVAGFMLTYNKHTLSLEDLGTLEEQNWLNDQIINMYGELIMEATQHKVHFFNSFFHKQLVAKGYDGVKRWTKKVDLFSKWLLLIPIHLEIHWSLITVTMATKTISYYDSQGIVFRHTTDNIMKYLLSEAKEKKQAAFQKGWKITIIKGIPQQKNDSDCGVFVLEYCRCLSVKQPLLFSQEDMPRIRKRIYKELCECRLND